MNAKLLCGEVHVVVTERDHDQPDKDHGPIVFETYIEHANIVSALDFAKRLGDKYGKVTICKLVPIGDIEETQKHIGDQPL